MTRPTHAHAFHRGLVPTAQLADGTATAGYAPVSDGDGTTTWGPAGFTPIIVSAECNSPIATHATPGTFNTQPFDTFYDRDFGTIADVESAGLSYASGVFTALEDGVWALNFGCDLTAAPGSTGRIQIVTPMYGYRPSVFVAAAANPPAGIVSITTAMRDGDTFHIEQYSAGSSVDLIDGYAALDIVRIAKGLL